MTAEFDLIGRYFRPLAGPEGLRLLDDAACISPTAGHDLIITKDLLVETVHFRSEDDPRSVARKALGVNLSDLAAKGAVPRSYFLGLSLPPSRDEAWIAGFAEGLADGQQNFGLALAGGDTTRNPDYIVISVTALGEVASGTMLGRGGAKAGDTIYVSGSLGDAALGLKCLSGELPHDSYLVDRYLYPQPRLSLGKGLVGLASACADISDGLVADTGHICKASNVGAVIYLDKLPLSAAASHLVRAANAPWQSVYAGGDDYELVFTAPADKAEDIAALSKHCAVTITAVGSIKAGRDIRLVDMNGELLQTDAMGYDHFE